MFHGIMYVASGVMVQRNGGTMYAVKRVSVFTLHQDDAVSMHLCPRALLVVYVCGSRESLPLCQMQCS